MAELRADIINKADFYPVWIPVTERLPDKDGIYIVSVKGKVVTDEFVNGFWFCSGVLVDAWMPLPEPYKPTNATVIDASVIREKFMFRL